MSIPLLNKEDVEKEDVEIYGEEKDIREQIIEFLKSKGYKHLPDSHTFVDDESDLFVNDEQLIQVIIDDEIPGEIIEQMNGMEQCPTRIP